MTERETVSLLEAARLTGLSADALRLRFRRGTLPGVRSGRKVLLYRDALPNTARSPTEHERALIDLLREQLAARDHQLATRDREISELHVLLGRLQERLLPPPAAPRRWWWWPWNKPDEG